MLLLYIVVAATRPATIAVATDSMIVHLASTQGTSSLFKFIRPSFFKVMGQLRFLARREDFRSHEESGSILGTRNTAELTQWI